jgi:Flp pilus assembly pilin Flp
MFKTLRNFYTDVDGAVTVDWVVLTAAIVGLGIAVIVTLSVGTNNVGATVGDRLSNGTIGELQFP